MYFYFAKGPSLWIILIVAALAKSAQAVDREAEYSHGVSIRSLKGAFLSQNEERYGHSEETSRDLKNQNKNQKVKDALFLQECSPIELADYLLDRRFNNDVDDTLSFLNKVIRKSVGKYGDDSRRALQQRFTKVLKIDLQKAGALRLAKFLMKNRFDLDLDAAVNFLNEVIANITGRPPMSTTSVQTTSSSTTSTMEASTTTSVSPRTSLLLDCLCNRPHLTLLLSCIQ